ncbi:MAG: hypothetical protein Q9214_000058 [Letrouitia sp. 1 TL-2023]
MSALPDKRALESLLEEKLIDPRMRNHVENTPSTPTSGTDRSSVGELSSRSSIDYDSSSDIAVIGMACRVAGGNNSPEKLWKFLIDQKHASGEIDPLRWEPYRRRDVRNAKELDKATSRGYFVEGIEDFDSSFFNISPKEAEMMDPQQRLSLEVCWEALESAGVAPQSLAGSNTAVYMGVNSDDYSKLLLEDLPDIEAWMGIGTAYCGVPNRISYHLDLVGPSTAVDAACASSLVAIHHGRQSLLDGEANLAIVGGVNALYGPGLTRVLDKAGAVSPEGLCRSFDDESSGYGRGEGVGIVILKRMDDALNDGDNIVAALKGTAVAQDGRTNGIMAPNGKAQELVAKKALASAGIEPSTIGYVEAHATSTPVGDPVEVKAISNIYGRGRGADDACYIGSIKPNIGHLEAGAGVLGFIKAAMTVNKGIIPPQTNLNKLNSRVNWEESGVQVVRKPSKWRDSDAVRRAAICSYGYGGSVSHAVIEQVSQNRKTFPTTAGPNDESDDATTILLLSAPQKKRLTVQAKSYQAWILGDGKEYSLASIATTLATRRGHHDHRSAFVVTSHEDAAEALGTFSKGSTGPWGASNRVLDSSKSTDSVWVFSGHGAQWKEMGREMLLNTIFHEAVASIDTTIMTEAGFSALQALKLGDFQASDRVQVLTYVMQIGLAAVLKFKGAAPQAVIGHSVGEIAASVVAGALTAEEGAVVVCRRAALYRKVMGLGAMVMVNSPYSDIQQELDNREDITVAIDSSPSSCVVSGTADTVAKFTQSWKDRGIKVIQVKSDIAFHSPALNKLVAPLSKSLANSIIPKPPSIKLYSTSLVDPRAQDPRGVQYWTNNMVKPVLLTQTVNAAIEDRFRVFMEVSSHPVVSHSIEETIISSGIEDYAIIPTMSRAKPAEKSILHSIAQLHCIGVPVLWKTQMPGDWNHHVPGTTWDHKRYVRKIETGPLNPANTHDVDQHNLLGQRIPILGESLTVYTTKVDQNTKPFPGNHPLHGTEIVPAAVLINTFYHGTGKRDLSDIVLRVPVAVSAPRDIQVSVQQGQVKLTSRLIQGEDQTADDMSWVTHTTGRIADKETSWIDAMETTTDIAAIKAGIGSQLNNTFSIDYLAGVGVSAMGFPWAVQEHFGSEKAMIAKVDVAPDVTSESSLPWNPGSWAPILDSATSIGSTLFFKEPRLRMPAQVHSVKIRPDATPPKIGYIYVQEATETELAVHIDVLDESGRLLARIQNMRFAEIEGTIGANGSVESLVHQLSWPPMPLAEQPLGLGHVMLVSKSEDALQKCQKALQTQAASITTHSSSRQIPDGAVPSSEGNKAAVIIYVPEQVNSFEDVAEAASRFCTEFLDIVKYAANVSLLIKVFAITENVSKGQSPTALAQAPLHGLARIIASEQPDIWGALIDNEDEDWVFPTQAIKYARGADVVRIHDGVARAARLRRLPRDKMLPSSLKADVLARPDGTYLITGGMGALGLEVANFLVENGARRLVLVSRRGLPARNQWQDISGPLAEKCRAIEQLETLGVTVHILSVDIGAEGSKEKLQASLNRLALPPVLGVVHAAGVLEDQLILSSTTDSFDRVLAPKITGGLALHQLFPVGTLDFFILFSSCGQLFGFPGQGSYASGNAFLDTLASYRRDQGDKCVAVQWTSWRGMGMAASTDFINAELESKGITDITRDEAFRAWAHLAKYDVDHGVVLRSRTFDHDEPLPTPVLKDIAVRRPAQPSTDREVKPRSQGSINVPTSGPALMEYVDVGIRKCVAETLQLASADDVDPRAALSDLGMDSVMTVTLRRHLQKAFSVQVPPTLMWSLPTASHLQKWFVEKLEKQAED